MGLVERGISPLGERSRVLHPHRSLGRLSWFDSQIPRRRFLKRAGKAVAGSAALALGLSTVSIAEANPASDSMTLDITQRIGTEVLGRLTDLGLEVDIGSLRSKAFDDGKGNTEIVFRDLVFGRNNRTNQFFLPDLLDQASQKGLDPKLTSGILGEGLALPARDQVSFSLEESLVHYQTDQDVADWVRKFNQVLDIGPVVGRMDYPEAGLQIFRTPKMGFMKVLSGIQANSILLVNVGDQMIAAGLIPQEAVLASGEIGTGGGSPASPDTSLAASRLTVINNLKGLMESEAGGLDGTVKNPEGLDPNEVAEYIAHPEKEVFNTFRIWSESNGRPRVIIVTGERPERAPAQGLTKPENIASVMASLDRLYSIDPTMFDTFEQYGFKAVAGYVPLFKINGASAGFSNGIIFLSEFGKRDDDLLNMFQVLNESRHLYTLTVARTRPDDLLDNNLGIDKALWIEKWMGNHSYAFTEGEQRAWRSLIRQLIAAYQQNPSLGQPLYY